MAEFRIELIESGVRELLRSADMEQICLEKAQEVCRRCPQGYETDTYRGKNRVNAMVWADSPEAREDNLKNNTLLKAVRK